MPRVSVIMPVFNVARFVDEAVRSILAQTFRDLELLVIDDGSTDGTPDLVEAIGDPRVRVIRNPHLGLAAVENQGVDRAGGEYFLLMDGDDVALPRLIEAQVETLDRHPETAAVCPWTRRFGINQSLDRPPADPRTIRRRLRRFWTLSNPTMYRTAVLREVGGFRDVFSDDWDLWIRIAARHDIRVVPEFLALIRSRPSSSTLSASRYVSREDKLRMRRQAIRRLGADPAAIALLVLGAPNVGLYRVVERFLRPRPRPPEPDHRAPTVTVVVPTYGRPELLARCLEGIALQDPPPDEIVVVHRLKDRETVAFLDRWAAEDPARHRTAHTGPGLVHALIAGTAAARGEVVAYLDDDAVPRQGWLAELRRAFLDPRVGAAGGRLLDHVDGRLLTERSRRVGVVTWYGRIIWSHNRECDRYGDVDWLTGSNMAIRRELAAHDGRLLHQSNGIAMANDLDVCLGVKRAGHRVLYSPWAEVEHHTTSFRDPVLGSRVEGEDVVSSSANHAYALLKHLPRWRRPFLHLYGYLIGSASLAGPVRILVEVLRSPRRAAAMARRMPLIWRGRRKGARMWKAWKRLPGATAAVTEPADDSVTTNA